MVVTHRFTGSFPSILTEHIHYSEEIIVINCTKQLRLTLVSIFPHMVQWMKKHLRGFGSTDVFGDVAFCYDTEGQVQFKLS